MPKRYELRLHDQAEYMLSILESDWFKYFSGKTFRISPEEFDRTWVEECQTFNNLKRHDWYISNSYCSTEGLKEIGEVWAVYDNYARRIDNVEDRIWIL